LVTFMAHVSPIGVAWVQEANDVVRAITVGPKRALTSSEVAALVAGGNRTADGSWTGVTVRAAPGQAFDPSTVARCVFVGTVELGVCASGTLRRAPFTML
jgi:hypothetical protein